ncbi:MAG: cell division protein FtsI [Lachnospiraceae bacterium]|nr:cell division protein FtsI [Lachnospiraceae bacterium]
MNRKINVQQNNRGRKGSNNGITTRAMILFGLCGVAFLALFVRLGMINKTKGEEYKHTVLSQRAYESVTLPYRRGSIVDRKGTTLAMSKKVYNVILDSYVVTQTEEKKEGSMNATLTALGQCFDMDTSEIRNFITQNPESRYRVLAKKLDYEVIEPFQNLVAAAKDNEEAIDIKGVWFEEEYLRYYPLGSVACDAIGYTNAGNAGAYGLEEYYNDVLNGTNGREYGYLNEDENIERTTIPATDGHTLVTTLDVTIQKIVEEKITDYNLKYTDNAREGHGSMNTGCIVMECDTGNVLAMAGYPFFDLNQPRNAELYFREGELREEPTEAPTDETSEGEEESSGVTSEEESEMKEEEKDDRPTESEALAALWKNFCISETYEPGSVAKPITVAMGLETGKMTGEETYYCGGLLEIGGFKIKCHNRNGDGMMSVSDAIAQSCNVSLMLMGEAIGKSTYLECFENFNFGLKTNVDLVGEARTASLVFNEQTMGPTELATSTFGQGYNVTMIQMACAFNSLVNGGYYYEPHMVSSIVDAEGSVVKNIEPRVLKQTISSSTSEKIIEYCKSVVTNGTGKRARPAGYAIGGKTGTAEMVVDGKRGSGQYVCSFMGFAPADDPQILIYVVIDRPNLPDQNGGTGEAALITREILTEVLPYLNIFMTEPLSEEEEQELKEKGIYDATLLRPEADETEEESGEPESDKQKPEMKIDPETGYGIDPHTGEYLDPETGYPINPGSSFITESNE